MANEKWEGTIKGTINRNTGAVSGVITGAILPPPGGGGSTTLLDGLIAHYSADEGSGALLNVHNPGVFDLPEAGAVGNVAGKIGTAREPSGTNKFMYSAGAVLDVTQPFTFSYWLYVTQGSAYRFRISTHQANNASCVCMMVPNTEHAHYFRAWDGAALQTVAMDTPASTWNAWAHFVCGYDGAQLFGYSNGIAEPPAAISQVDGTYNNGLEIANQYDAAVGGGGIFIDQLDIWQRAVTADEVALLFNGGAGLPYESY